MTRNEHDANKAMQEQAFTPDYMRGFSAACDTTKEALAALDQRVSRLRDALVYGVMLALLVGIGIGVAAA